MNKRIEELAEQCTSYNNSDGWLFDKAKFAELIVWETFAAMWTDECMQSDLALEQFNRNVNNIKKHFGMKNDSL
jgi:hypothetical protein